MQLGILECFFGPPWSMQDRHSWAAFLAEHNFDFYMYAPKADQFLRKRWHETWPSDYLGELTELSRAFRSRKLQFGVALSPMGTGAKLDRATKEALKQKCESLSAIGIDQLGLFFDDMMAFEGMVDTQLEILDIVRASTKARLIFCPSYYSDDPILDKVFGARPLNYVRDIGAQVPADVDIAWTGPKVISPEISAAHLVGVGEVLHRLPFLCDNLFANDGPKNCKFLKLRPPSGRSSQAFAASEGWSLNPMNQPELSKIVCLAMKLTCKDGIDPDEALAQAIVKLCSRPLADFIYENLQLFYAEGLDRIDDPKKRALKNRLTEFHEPVAKDIQRWLDGDYTVGSECLTD